MNIKIEDGKIWGLLTDLNLMLEYRTSLHLIPTSIGTVPHVHMQKEILGPPFVYNTEQMQYLYEHGRVDLYQNVESSFKYRVFKHFTDRGKYLGNGGKFGCDYLVYEGDPLVTHARYMLVIAQEINATRLIQLGRLSNSSLKDLIIAYEEGSEIKVKKITWMPELSISSEKPLAREKIRS